jgi:hypothetical protein
MDFLYFLGDFGWGLFGLFRRSAAQGSRQYQLAGMLCLLILVASWAVCFVGAESWRLVLFSLGLLSPVGAMFCGYMRLDFGHSAK